MGELTKLPNIGKALESQLNEIGVETYDDLVIMGAEQAWLKIRSNDKSA